MSYLIVVMPGLSLACVTFLTIIGLNQLWIYQQTGYNRSWNIGMFCLLAAVFAGEPFVVQSRMLPISFTHYYTMVSAACHCLASIYYLWALNFFLAIPDWVRRAVTFICGLFAFVAFSSLFSFSFFGESLFLM